MKIDDAAEFIFNEWDNLNAEDQKQLLDDLCSVAAAGADYYRRETRAREVELRRSLTKLEADYLNAKEGITV